LARLAQFLGVTEIRLDFVCYRRKTFLLCDYLPPEFSSLAGSLRIGIELSLYPSPAKPTQEGNNRMTATPNHAAANFSERHGNCWRTRISCQRNVCMGYSESRNSRFLPIINAARAGPCFHGSGLMKRNIISGVGVLRPTCEVFGS
jgi:hypothetical protein